MPAEAAGAKPVRPSRRPFPDVPDAVRNTMRANASRHTAPEMAVRRMLHALGFRYRLHRSDLPGTPDLVFPSRRKVIMVHGCFWHHHGCQGGRLPATRQDYWRAKFDRNRARDARDLAALAATGWSATTVWECELTRPLTVRKRLLAFLNDES